MPIDALDEYLYGDKEEQAEAAWCAKLYEAKGSVYSCLRKTKGKGKSSTRSELILRISLTDFDALQRFQEFVDYGAIYGPFYDDSDTEPVWHFIVEKPYKVKLVMEKLLPWLSQPKVLKWKTVCDTYDKATGEK